MTSDLSTNAPNAPAADDAPPPVYPTGLTPLQYKFLLAAVPMHRVLSDPNGHPYVASWDVRRTIIQAFGPGGWDLDVTETSLVDRITHEVGTLKMRRNNKEVTNDQVRYTVVYKSTMRLTVHLPNGRTPRYMGSACGGSINQISLPDAHDNACKTAESLALRRCAVNWGDQFGLGLYNKNFYDRDLHRWRPAVGYTLLDPPASVLARFDLPAADDTPVADDPDSLEGGDGGGEVEAVEGAHLDGIMDAITNAANLGQARTAWHEAKTLNRRGQLTEDQFGVYAAAYETAETKFAAPVLNGGGPRD